MLRSKHSIYFHHAFLQYPESRLYFSHFTIFPVPAYDFVKIGMELDGERKYTYTIANSLGNKCGHSHLLNSMAIDIAHLVPGIYVLMLEKEGLIVGVGKFIKM